MTDFYNEYYGFFPALSSRALYELAIEYHTKTEEYDQSICSYRDKNGIATPISAAEVSKCSKYASLIFVKLANTAESLGYSKEEFRNEIIKTSVRATGYKT